MDAAMSNASSAVSTVMLIIVLAFVVSHGGVGFCVKKNGGSAKLAQLGSSVTTLMLMLG